MKERKKEGNKEKREKREREN